MGKPMPSDEAAALQLQIIQILRDRIAAMESGLFSSGGLASERAKLAMLERKLAVLRGAGP